MANSGQKLLSTMLSRLYAAMAAGPLLNSRPHRSRQRICLHELSVLEGPRPAEILSHLLSEPGKVKLAFPSCSEKCEDESGKGTRDPLVSLQTKLKLIASDAVSYEKQTGSQALFLGYPLLSLPAGISKNAAFSGKRVLAPLAFIPVSLRLNTTRRPIVHLESTGDGAELVIANQALLVWAQQVTGQRTDELFVDEAGAEPWREISEISAAVCRLFEIPLDGPFTPQSNVIAVPPTETDAGEVARIVPAGVLGLFPLSNQSLLRDLEAMVEGEPAVGPIRAFLEHDLGFKASTSEPSPFSASHPNATAQPTVAVEGIGDDRAISEVDPCQLQAILAARRAEVLVLHGPPGTGKSQTIANVIADHLARGQRVLFVCDKRTALDVVEARLRVLGLSELCAVVHDTRRDEKELYRSIRDQLDALEQAADLPAQADALVAADKEIKALLAKLAAYHRSSTKALNDGALSFQDLVARLLQLEEQTLRIAAVRQVSIATFESQKTSISELIDRARAAIFAENPWERARGISLSEYLAQPPTFWERQLGQLHEVVQKLDSASAQALPLVANLPLSQQIQSRTQLVQLLAQVFQARSQLQLQFWAGYDTATRARAAADVWALLPCATALCQMACDAEVVRAFAQQPLPSSQEIEAWSIALADYRATGDKWYGAICVGKQQAAREILARFGLPLSAESSQRGSAFLEQLRQRRRLYDWYSAVFGPTPVLPSDTAFLLALQNLTVVFHLLAQIEQDPALSPVCATLLSTLRDVRAIPPMLGALQDSIARAEQLIVLETCLGHLSLLNGEFKSELQQEAYSGRPLTPILDGLQSWLGYLEGALRVLDGISALPGPLASAIVPLLGGPTDTRECLQAIERGILEGTILQHLEATPELGLFDEEHYQSCFARFTELRSRRHQLAKSQIGSLWQREQRRRLMTDLGNRLSSTGAELKRRFLLRGEKALRLRQAISAGRSVTGGDPLFSLRPVWMTSPEVAAQIFPRETIFDLLVFDEASQCRIEEALPILLRAKRVLIAGDPEQLPPTRFFESAQQAIEVEEPETSQELFEQQQCEMEDLLGLSLNLAVEQTYLDVHYRSRHPALIAFSNQYFYDKRLLPLPSPRGRLSNASPIQLVAVNGVYERRENAKEASAVVEIVKRLLSSDNPPSIGIACFNLAQRDLITNTLDEAALTDEAFGAQLELARNRQGEGAFEGLFVKNLENVQGDERDHLIISTTYGPDASGRFFRRFGPLAQASGGRRLNVLVTRAREQVHLVTSIPREVYRALPPLEDGKKPNGAWLLLAYLAFAEEVTQMHDSRAALAMPEEQLGASDAEPTLLAGALKRLLLARGVDVCAPWGSTGLGTELSFAERATQGSETLLCCDLSCYKRASDSIEWDFFREQVLRRQGFTIRRVFSPQLFRNREATLTRLLVHHEAT